MNLSKAPVILDTDIGTDIDDTWALGLMLKSPELDVKLITTTTGDTHYRAKIVCKMLDIAGRADIPVGIGIVQEMDLLAKKQAQWVEDYNLDQFQGKVHENGIEAMIRTIMDSPDVIKLICIGPLTNIKVALDREPDIVKYAHFIGMQGSIDRGYNGQEGVTAEYNVAKDIPSAQKVLTAEWQSITITPLDTCGLINLQGSRYQAVKKCQNPITAAVIENYCKWNKPDKNFERESTVLFDTVAIYLALSEEYLVMKEMKIKVGDDGKMREDNSGRSMNVAIDWENQNAFLDFLVAQYTR